MLGTRSRTGRRRTIIGIGRGRTTTPFRFLPQLLLHSLQSSFFDSIPRRIGGDCYWWWTRSRSSPAAPSSPFIRRLQLSANLATDAYLIHDAFHSLSSIYKYQILLRSLICSISSPALLPISKTTGSSSSQRSSDFRLCHFSGVNLVDMSSKAEDIVGPVKEDGGENMLGDKRVTVVFVLGGPGSGKGTQCANIVEHFGFTHLSAGDLLRAEIKSGSENGTMIQNMIKEGKIVPSEVTVKLLQRAMSESKNDKFLIDGFPRNEENRAAFENVTKIKPEFILFFDCSEQEMEKRLLGRNQGREDDNIETIRKRFKVFVESSVPVVEHYESEGKVRKIEAEKTVEEVFEAVKSIFAPYALKVNGSEDYSVEKCANGVKHAHIA